MLSIGIASPNLEATRRTTPGRSVDALEKGLIGFIWDQKIKPHFQTFIGRQIREDREQLVSQVFGRILEINEQVLGSISFESQSKILFALYKKKMFEKMSSLLEVKDCLKCKDKIGSVSGFSDQEIVTILFCKYVNAYYYTFPQITIQRAFKGKGIDVKVNLALCPKLQSNEEKIFKRLTVDNLTFFE